MTALRPFIIAIVSLVLGHSAYAQSDTTVSFDSSVNINTGEFSTLLIGDEGTATFSFSFGSGGTLHLQDGRDIKMVSPENARRYKFTVPIFKGSANDMYTVIQDLTSEGLITHESPISFRMDGNKVYTAHHNGRIIYVSKKARGDGLKLTAD